MIKNMSPSAERAPDLSIVIPMFNEAASIGALFDRLQPVLDALGLAYEVVCVNDGSRDDTLGRLLALAPHLPYLRVVDLSRNFGKERALSAGLAHARGRAVIPFDADLQHPPETIPALVAKWREGYDVVYAVREARTGQGLLQRLYAKLYYRLFARLAEVKLPEEAGDFRLMDRKVVDVINRMPERSRFMKGIFAWVGFRQVGVPYPQGTRTHGTSRFNFLRLLRFGFDGLTAFSNFPLRIWGWVGAAIAGFAFLYIIVRLVRVALWGVDVPGYESIIVTVLFLGGVQLLTLGIIGDYLGRVYEEVKGRPLYIVRGLHGFPSDAAAAAEAVAPQLQPQRTPLAAVLRR